VSGMDVYVDGKYAGTVVPNAEGVVGRLKGGAAIAIGQARAMRDVTIYLPLYSSARVTGIKLEAGSKVEAASPYAVARPIVYYGSSITQGGCASNAGGSYQAILGRWLNVDFVNLGFSGKGLGEPAVARAVAEIDAAVFVLDYWANPSVEVLRETLPGFVDVIRAKHPETPIVIPGPYWEPADENSAEGKKVFEGKREVLEKFVEERRASGDLKIQFVDGYSLLGPGDSFGLVDGRHANSAGFYLMAKGLEGVLRGVLGMGESR